MSCQRVSRAGVALAAGLASLSLVALGCGGSSAPSVANLGSATVTNASTSSSGSTQAWSRSSALAFVSCMRDHGEPNFPDPLAGGGYSRSEMQALDPTAPRFQSAQKACSSFATASGFTHTPAEVRQHVKVLLAVAECMRAHGVTDSRDPDSAGTILVTNGSQSNPNSPQYRAAAKICNRLNPGTG